MRIDFNILWIEDQQSAVQSQLEALRLKLEQHGFRLEAYFFDSAEQAINKVEDEVFADHIDLILIDYNLSGDLNGYEGIKKIRKKLPYKDTIFYSASRENLEKIESQKAIQGTFLSHRGHLPIKAYEVFQNLIKKVLDIDHARGIVMGSTSDIDSLIQECISISIDNSVISNDDALKIIKKRLTQIEENFKEHIKNLNNIEDAKDIFTFYHIYTSSDRIRLLINILKSDAKFKSYKESLSDYLDNVVPARNSLAHTCVEKNDFKRSLRKKDSTILTRTDVQNLMIKSMRQEDLLQELLKLLKN